MSQRFFLNSDLSGESAVLDGTEAHHLLHVMRAKPGDRVELFNGRGIVTAGEVLETARKTVTVALSERTESPAPHGPTLCTAIPKGDRFRWLVEKATELGVSKLVPLETRRSVVSPGDRKLEKLSQTVIAACKQSGQNWLMELAPVISLEQAIGQVADSGTSLVAHPTGETLSSLKNEESPPSAFFVGPEGGFDDREVEMLVLRGAKLVSLGESILRTETAGIALAAWWCLEKL